MIGHTLWGRARYVTLALALGAALAASSPNTAMAADDKTYTMKLGSLTNHDEVNEWLNMFVAGIEKKSGGRLKERDLSLGSSSAAHRARSKARNSEQSRPC